MKPDWKSVQSFTVGEFSAILNILMLYYCSKTENAHTVPNIKFKIALKTPPRNEVSQITSEATYLIDLFTTPGFNKRDQSAGYWSI